MADKHFDEMESAFEADPMKAAQKTLEQNAPFAVAAVLDIMHNSLNDNTRLRAAQEVLARSLGPIGKDDQQGTLEAFLKDMERLANEGGK